MFSSKGVATSSAPVGQHAYTTVGTSSFTVPAGVTSICVVAVSGGQGGGNTYGGDGGALRYKNSIAVTPNEVLTVLVGAGGNGQDAARGILGEASIIRRGVTPIFASSDPLGSGVGGGGGGQGGYGHAGTGTYGSYGDGGGGGGAGGYSGNGGRGNGDDGDNTAGTGGAASGGDQGPGSFDSGVVTSGFAGKGGGGVGLLGQGASGAKAASFAPGKGGSGGADGNNIFGGLYGGGGGGGGIASDGSSTAGFAGGQGAVRIIWGTGRAFPSTLTGDM